MRVYPQIKSGLLGDAAASASAELWTKFPQLQAWIDGEKKPTVNQLADFAKAVHIPFGFFFLEQLPAIKNTVPLFRTSSKQAHFDYSYELRESINSIQKRQDWLVDYLLSEQYDALPFVGKFNTGDSHTVIANDIRKVLQLPVNWSQFLYDKDAALKHLIQKAEAAGIYVAMNGVLGNSSKNLNPEEFKGFVLSNKYAPYIFINGKDYPAAKIFTFMHELAHIWLDKSAALDIERLLPANTETEKLCDAVAAELLVSKDVLIAEWIKVEKQANPLDYLERFFKVSKVVIARRLLDLGIYSKAQFFAFYNTYKAFWDNKKENEDGGGGSFYNNQPYRVGIKFFETVNAATASGKLLYTDAYKLTNLYGSTFSKFKTHLEN
jgi:Zn-dependent peptidase ImmA (M78 family)